MCDLSRSNSIKASGKTIGATAYGFKEEHSNRRPNNRLKLTAPSVHAFCISAGVVDPGPRGTKACPSARSLT